MRHQCCGYWLSFNSFRSFLLSLFLSDYFVVDRPVHLGVSGCLMGVSCQVKSCAPCWGTWDPSRLKPVRCKVSHWNMRLTCALAIGLCLPFMSHADTVAGTAHSYRQIPGQQISAISRDNSKGEQVRQSQNARQRSASYCGLYRRAVLVR